MGTIGAPVSIAMKNGPLLNPASRPSSERVPSAKNRTCSPDSAAPPPPPPRLPAPPRAAAPPHRNELGQPHRSPQQRNPHQPLLQQHRALPRQHRHQHRRVQVRHMVRQVDAAHPRRHMIPARSHPPGCPPTRSPSGTSPLADHPVQQTHIAHHKRVGNANQSRKGPPSVKYTNTILKVTNISSQNTAPSLCMMRAFSNCYRPKMHCHSERSEESPH